MKQYYLSLAILLLSVGVQADSLRLVPIDPVVDTGHAQSVQADKRGQAYLFTDQGQIFLFDGNEVGEEISTPYFADLLGKPFHSGMSIDGDTWLFAGADRRSVVVVKDAEVITEINSPNAIDAMAMWDDSVVINVHSSPKLLKMMDTTVLADEPDPSELVVTYVYDQRDQKWSAHSTEDLPADDEVAADRASYYLGSVLLAGDEERKLWVANQYEYRIRRYSSARKPLLDIRMEDIRTPENWDEAEEKMAQQLKEMGVKTKKITGFSVAPGEKVVRALTSSGGDAYLLWREKDTPANEVFLDRVSSMGEVLRVRLKAPTANTLRSLAIGKDHVFLASANSKRGLYSLNRLQLEESWMPVEIANGGVGEKKSKEIMALE